MVVDKLLVHGAILESQAKKAKTMLSSSLVGSRKE